MRRFGARWALVAAALAIIGCRRTEEHAATSAASASPSPGAASSSSAPAIASSGTASSMSASESASTFASTSASALAASGTCNDGVFAASPAPIVQSIATNSPEADNGIGKGNQGESGSGGGGLGDLVTIGEAPASTAVIAAPTMRLDGKVTSLAGSVDPVVIGRSVCSSFGAFRVCFGKTGATGSVDVAMHFGSDGHVDSATATGGTIADPVVVGCLVAAAQKISLPTTSGEATLGYSFRSSKHVAPIAIAKVKETSVLTQGALPPEVVKRIVRSRFGQLRKCYEQLGLAADPNAKGTLTTRFMIDQTGSVEMATLAGGTMTSSNVGACVVSIFRTMKFPQPESGKVLVAYTVDFERD